MATVKASIGPQQRDDDDWDRLSDGVSAISLADNDDSNPDLDSTRNPVGELQELCVKNRWSFPEYKEEYKSGLPHLTTFLFTCSVNAHSVTGSGRSKRLAKKASATAMLAILDSEPATNATRLSQAVAARPELQEIENALNELSMSADAGKPEKASAASIEEQLMSFAGKFNVPLVFNAGSDIEGRSVWISKLEDKVITGYGETPLEARIDAGKAVIHHLRMKVLG